MARISLYTTGLLDRLFPFISWMKTYRKGDTIPDLEAGLVGAILILPQSIALASLAGMPPEFGIYTSIFPVIIASIWGASWHTLSGPNTAVCVVIAYSVAPFASIGNDIYIGYVLALTLMVGVIQLLLGLMRLGAVLDFISHTVISAIVFAVALIIIVSASSSFLGVLGNADESFFVRLYQTLHDLPSANLYSLSVGLVTVATGFIAKRWWKRFALIIAVLVGSLFGTLLNIIYGSASTELVLVGNLSMQLLPLSFPSFEIESLYVLKELSSAAFAIAFLGLMQTIVISRSIANKSGQVIETNREVIGQGLSNLVAPFLSSFAGSGSFNRSAAHFDAGAKTPMAAVYASFILLIAVVLGSQVISYIPEATIAGALILVGYGLINTSEIRQIFLSRQESVVFSITFLSSLVLGLNSGVFVGFILSLVLYLWYASAPNVVLEEHTARDGRSVSVCIIDGNLFFGSSRHVERILRQLGDPQSESIILIRTDHMTYLDVAGATMLTGEVKRRRECGDDLFIYVTRNNVVEALRQSGCLDVLGDDHLIYKNSDHEMKNLLYPQQKSSFIGSNRITLDSSSEKPQLASINHLKTALRSIGLLAPLSPDQLEELISASGFRQAEAGEIIQTADKSMDEYIILLEGTLEIQREVYTGNEQGENMRWILQPKEQGFAFLDPANNTQIKATSAAIYFLLDVDKIDTLTGWNEQFADEIEQDSVLKHRINLIRRVSLFHKIPFEKFREAFARMHEQKVEAGDTIFEQGQKGDSFYLIESGNCEVIVTDAFTHEASVVNRLSAGDAFGQDALIQDSYRSATIKMTTPGNLLVLYKKDFNDLLHSEMIREIDTEQAQQFIQSGEAKWLDCRYDMEHKKSHLSGATLIPLNNLRHELHRLDQNQTYIVYCRNGRRSRLATYLLTEHGIDAMSLKGGISQWPFEIDVISVN